MREMSEKGIKTKAKIVETARELFHKNGVKATSVDEILKISGAGKSQFYHYFKNKDDIVHAVLQFYLEIFKQGTGSLKLQINSWDDLEEFFYSHIRGIEMFNSERSCPIGSIGNELSSENELIRQDVNLIFEYVRNNLSNFFADLKAEGKLNKTADPESLADFGISTVQGALLLAKVRKDSKAAEHTVDHALKYLKSFSK